jgi:hypothetical protein
MSTLKLTFDPTLSDALNIHIMKPKIIDLSILMGESFALDDFGLAYEVVSNAEFLILAGHAPMIRPDPGPAHGAGAVLTNWKKSDDMKTMEKTGKITLRGILLSTFPDRMFTSMKVQRSLHTRSTQYIMTQLYERHGTLTELDLAYLSAQLKKPCPADVSPDAFLADWQASLGDLAQFGQAIPQLMATDHLQSCFGPEYVDCWRAFVRDFPQLADRTVDRLCAAIITFSQGELPILSAHTLIGANQVIALQAQVKELQQDLQALAVKQWTPAATAAPAAPAAAPSHRGKRGATTTKGAATKQAKGALTPFSVQPFCWSHGPCKHLGTGCGDRTAGHKEQATWQNQMGSPWKQYYETRGYSVISP